MLIHKREREKNPRFQRSKFPVSFKKNQSPSELEKGFPPNSPSTHAAIDKDAEKVLGSGPGGKVGKGRGSWNGMHLSPG